MREQKITLGEMRQSGVYGLLVYCGDYRCSNHITISSARWPDDLRLSDLEPRFVCKVCGLRGADVPAILRTREDGTRRDLRA